MHHGRHLLLLLMLLLLLLLLLLSKIIIGPAPFLLQLRFQEVNAPSSLLFDFFENGDDLVLFDGVDKALSCERQATNGYTGNTSTFGK